MMNIKNAICVATPAILMLCILLLSIGIGVADSTKEIQDIVNELEGQSQNLVNISKTIHDNTENIADDESLDEEIRAEAESIHLASHDLWHLAEHVCQHVEGLEGLCGDPQTNEMEAKAELDEIAEHLEEYATILEDQEDSVHSVLFAVPESHMEYADATHNALHEAEDVINDITEGANELAAKIGLDVDDITPVSNQGRIQIYDKQGELINRSIEGVAKEAHGDLCLCAAAAARTTQVAIIELFGEEIPTQGDLKVTYHHPGEGHKDCLEYILSPECTTYEPTGDPKNLTLDNFAYTFVRTDNGVTFETKVKDGVISEEFFDLRYKVKGFTNGWHNNPPTEAEMTAFKQKKSEARNNILTMEAHQVFENVNENVAGGQKSITAAT